jgi:hypothetical protein
LDGHAFGLGRRRDVEQHGHGCRDIDCADASEPASGCNAPPERVEDAVDIHMLGAIAVASDANPEGSHAAFECPATEGVRGSRNAHDIADPVAGPQTQ